MSLLSIFAGHEDLVSDKWIQYIYVYDRELSRLVAEDKAVSLLEVGVQNGGSLQLWRKLLPMQSRIVGIDIDERCKNLSLDADTEIRIADAGDPEALKSVINAEKFDIIIDDGSHHQNDVVATLKTLFDSLLPGGLYFIEDLHCSYWKSHGGGLGKKGSAIERLKEIVDMLNADHIEVEERSLVNVDALNSSVARIGFYDSIAVLEKYPVVKEQPFRRAITGGAMPTTGVHALASAVASDLSGFVFAPAGLAALEGPVIESLRETISDKDRQIDLIRSELERCENALKGLQAPT